MRLIVQPITLREANAYVAAHHRHHKPARGCRFCLSVVDDGTVHGVAIISRPVARHLDDGLSAEVVRLCTDGTRNACSMLYGAAWRACRAMGYRRLLTYTLPEEGGASLRAAGWALVGQTTSIKGWSRPSRKRTDGHPIHAKMRWEAPLATISPFTPTED